MLKSFLKSLFSARDDAAREIGTDQTTSVGDTEIFHLNDRVINVFDQRGVVTHIDPKANSGLGQIDVRYDDGRCASFALLASGLRLIKED